MNATDPAVLEAVRTSTLARDLTPGEVPVLASALQLARFAQGEVLAREGSADTRLVVVVDGSLGVVKGLGGAAEARLLTLNGGDFAHELGFLDGAERYASLVALTEARVLLLARADLERLIDSHPRVVYGVMCAIVRTVHRIQTRLSVQATELTNYIVKQHGRY